MIGSLMFISDIVTVAIDEEAREWGYNPCPDGTKATIVGFSEVIFGESEADSIGVKPGVYVNREWVKLLLADGTNCLMWSGYLTLVDEEEYGLRLAGLRKKQKTDPSNWYRREFLRELP